MSDKSGEPTSVALPEPLGFALGASGRRLLLATRAHHKARELQELLDLPGVVLLTPDEVGIDGEPVEDAEFVPRQR